MITAVPTALLVVGAIGAAVVLILVFRSSPRVAFAAWTLTLFFVPVWVGFTLGLFWAAIIALTALLIVINWSAVPLRVADLWIGGFVAVSGLLYVLGMVTLPAAVVALTEWIVPYIWGRVLLARVDRPFVTRVIATVAVVAAILTLVEFVFHFNPFVLIPGSGESYDTWRPLQERGGLTRAEGAFGHSIALGASLAMSTAFIVATNWRALPKILAVAVVGAATVATFSRAGLLTLVLTLVLAVFLLPDVSRRFRLLFIAFAVVSAAFVLTGLDAVFSAAEDDLEVSGGYRSDLLVLLAQVRLFGNSGDWTTRVAGDHYLGYFARSIDNALLVSLLRLGWVPTLLLSAAVVCAALTAFRRPTRNPAALAVIGQLPSLVVVALITQYGMFLWFCVGLALTWPQRQRGEGADWRLDRESSRPPRHLEARPRSARQTISRRHPH